MNKAQFLSEIREGISSLSEKDIESSLQYYSEMIDDRIEDGMSEEESVSAMGTVEEAVAQILRDKPAAEPDQNKGHKGAQWARQNLTRNKRLLLVLLILSFPFLVTIAGSLLIVVISVAASLYASSIGVFVGGIACAVKGVALIAVETAVAEAILYFGVALMLLGASVLIFIAAHYFVKLMGFVCKKVIAFIKSKLPEKEAN